MKHLSLELGQQQFAYSGQIPPAFTIDDQETVLIETMDAFCNTVTPELGMITRAIKPGDNPLVGPIHVSNAEPGDALKIEILSIEPTRDYAVSGILPAFGGLTANAMSPLLNPPLEERCFFYRRLENGQFAWNNRLCFDYKPFIGSIATTPAIGAPRSVDPFSNGGNMDVPDVAPGNTLYLPVCVPGAMLYVGDVHAGQGQGEVCGSALEISAKVKLKISVVKKLSLRWPRIETERELLCIGCTKPMEDAARIAYFELLHWLQELDWPQDEAYQAITQAGKLNVGSMVNSLHSMVARIDKAIAHRK